MRQLAAALAERRQQGLYRSRRILEGPQDVQVRIDGRDYLSFCSNDYLGLASDPRLVEALKEGAERFGVGSGAAHLVSGHSRAHELLEEELAEFLGVPRVLLFSTGYMANLGVVTSLAGRGDTVFEDRLNHASLIDAARLAGAALQRYRHNDVDSLERRMSQQERGSRLIASDAVFSMDGDCAPVARLGELAAQRKAWLLLDDAHGFGVLGEGGRGLVAAQLRKSGANTVLMATLGKALGVFGAFVAGSEELVETLIQGARSFIYTTAPPPALAWATRVALRLVREGDERRAHLRWLVRRFRTAAAQLDLPLMSSDTPIQPLLIGDSAAALAFSRRLARRGILVTAIRPPTVPKGSARLRITFSASHTGEQVDRLVEALGDARDAAR
ncbi:MAG TPA: 8-amino-7-oxononanoate synthase [Gammaproteobacteria bacterium]|nr:8-amino-7-oxononanoate synthase [Gammaproteobacteria bacterium]